MSEEFEEEYLPADLDDVVDAIERLHNTVKWVWIYLPLIVSISIGLYYIAYYNLRTS